MACPFDGGKGKRKKEKGKRGKGETEIVVETHGCASHDGWQ
jgi:hypothetical protein